MFSRRSLAAFPPSRLLKNVVEGSRCATLIQRSHPARTKDSSSRGFGFESCASPTLFRVFQQPARHMCFLCLSVSTRHNNKSAFCAFCAFCASIPFMALHRTSPGTIPSRFLLKPCSKPHLPHEFSHRKTHKMPVSKPPGPRAIPPFPSPSVTRHHFS